jgi:hypothetical protein
MIIKSASYKLGKSRPGINRKSFWLYFLFPELGIATTSIAVITLLMTILPNITSHHIYVSFEASLYSLSGSIPGVILFMAIEGLLIIAFMMILRLRWSRPMIFILFLLCVFGILLLANSIPVVMYAELVDRSLLRNRNWPVPLGVAIALLTANGMLLFFTHTIFTNIWNELKQNYVRASKFRGDEENNSLNEKIKWIYYSQITPVFYFVFSFTLFTDIVFQNEADEQGIVTTLFDEVTQNGFEGENIGRIVVWGLTMLSVILLVRILTSLPLRMWEAKNGVLQT